MVYAEYRQTLRELEKHAGKQGLLLEIGSNTGFFLKVAKDQGWKPLGVEISKTMAEIARRQFDVDTIAGDWLIQKYAESFDVVYCSHVIEHIPDPKNWMRRFREVLK